MTTPTVDEVLAKAERLIRRGWIKGRYAAKIDGKNCYCLSGALMRASGAEFIPEWENEEDTSLRFLGRTPEDAIDPFYAAIDRLQSVSGAVNITVFNDRAQTTREDVLDLIKRARSAQK